MDEVSDGLALAVLKHEVELVISLIGLVELSNVGVGSLFVDFEFVE